MNIDLDRTKINKNDIDGDGKPDGKPLDELFDGVGYEKETIQNKISNKELKFKNKEFPQSINLHLGNGLRLVERFINKYFGYLVGNNENPVPDLNWLSSSRLNIVYLIIIVVLIIFLWIK
ncbi:MAG: hypothetical protein IPK06_04410 [Ignavibacteriae bacterium]|nr:hypothetical protein [Ignavibacteriota bacterium]